GLNITSGQFGGDEVSILQSGATGVFADKNVADGKSVTLNANGTGVLNGADAGNYVIDASGLDAVTANVTPADLLIVAEDASRSYGSHDPAFTARYEGLMGDDAADVVSGLVLESSSSQTSAPGTYAITGSGATAAN